MHFYLQNINDLYKTSPFLLENSFCKDLRKHLQTCDKTVHSANSLL